MYLMLLTIYTEDNHCISAPACLYPIQLPSSSKCDSCLEWPRHSVTLTEDQTLLRRPHSSSPCITNCWPCLTNSWTSTGTHWDSLGLNGPFLHELFHNQSQLVTQLQATYNDLQT